MLSQDAVLRVNYIPNDFNGKDPLNNVANEEITLIKGGLYKELSKGYYGGVV